MCVCLSFSIHHFGLMLIEAANRGWGMKKGEEKKKLRAQIYISAGYVTQSFIKGTAQSIQTIKNEGVGGRG